MFDADNDPLLLELADEIIQDWRKVVHVDGHLLPPFCDRPFRDILESHLGTSTRAPHGTDEQEYRTALERAVRRGMQMLHTRENTHDTVGWRFRFFGNFYRCTRWARPAGFYMRLIEYGPEPEQRPLGYVTCVSEAAIGRTYHRFAPWSLCEVPIQHEQPCNCWVCEKRG